MFTVKVCDSIDPGRGCEYLVGDVTSVMRVFDEPKNPQFDPNPGLVINHAGGETSHYSHGRFYVMNEQGATVATYTLDAPDGPSGRLISR